MAYSLCLSLSSSPRALPVASASPSLASPSSSSSSSSPDAGRFSCCSGCSLASSSGHPLRSAQSNRTTRALRSCNYSRSKVVCMAPEEEKLTRRNPLDFPIEWDRPKPGRRPDIFPQFSPMKTPLPPPLPYDPPEEDEEEEEKKGEEEEEDPEKEEPEKPEKQ
ncbi:uncharacterized protein LOC116201956 [Punica granatum]|uniref:Uncharacterized protein n=2 Tax=Punica granatum TaxID=22663 RepID=A0A2I0KDR2_PUNGR|nr:uncharacterized protein LOC116201956 [Punica granatum]PKI66665.1 hypothetical protein CRG98_012860 [Punica granatum]